MNRGVRRELAVFAGLASLGSLLAGRKGAAKILAGTAAALHFWPSLAYSVRNRAVVITGSSRGLGLALAEEFLRKGARVALLARDSEELDRAQALLNERVSGQVFAFSCDVTQPAEVKRAFELIEGVFGRIDILVNNAGSIVIGPADAMERADYEALLNLQVHAIVQTTQTVLPIFRQFGGGRIANICSIGGKIAVPHMSVYCAGKFALAGLSAVMAAEYAAENIVITTVFPSMMRVGSTVQAVIKGDHEKEYAWFALGAAIPGFSVSAQKAARQIVRGICAGDAQVLFPATAKLANLAQANFPELFALALRTAARFFPQGKSPELRTGAESRDWLESQRWYPLVRSSLESAVDRNNQEKRAGARFNLGI